MKENQSIIAVKFSSEFNEQCQQLATHLDLQLVDGDSENQFNYVFEISSQGLALQQIGAKAAGPVRVDFASGAAEHRRKRGGGELLVKAVAGNKSNLPHILDATAGLGRDGFVLASYGYTVTLCERSPLISALLEDGLIRCNNSDDPELQAIIKRMHFKNIDAMDYFNTEACVKAPDVVVIDPMFPPSKKSALVKKEMQAFQCLVGKDMDSEQLLSAAMACANYRVVVKRPKKAQYLADKKPNFSVEGKAIRFDIYTIKAFSK